RIVSKEHCRITRTPDGGYIIRDVGSLNGVYVNGERIAEKNLSHDDQITLGNTVLRFHSDKTSAIALGKKHLEESQIDEPAYFRPAGQLQQVQASTGFKYDAFVSYSSIDAAVAEQVALLLKHSGLSVWFDQWFIRPGQNVQKQLDEGITQS